MKKTQPEVVPQSKEDVRTVSTDEKLYTTPILKTWGTVFDLTRTGLTNPGPDAKSGSVLSMGQ